MRTDVTIVNGKVFGSSGATAVRIEAGQFAAVGREAEVGRAGEVIDARGGLVLPGARLAQGFFGLGARFQGVLQAGLRHGFVQFEQFALQGFELGSRAAALFGRQLQGAAQFVQAVAQRAHRVVGLLGGAFLVATLLAGLLGLGGQFLDLHVQRRLPFLLFGQHRIQGFEARLGLVAPGGQFRLLRADVPQVAVQATGLIVGAGHLLADLVVLHPGVVLGLHALGDLQPRRLQGLFQGAAFGIGPRMGVQGLIGDQLGRLDFAGQIVDLLLAGQQTGLFGIRRVEARAAGIHAMPGLDDPQPARGQFGTARQGLAQVVGHVHPLQPAGQQGPQRGVPRPHPVQQRDGPRRRRNGIRGLGGSLIKGQARGRRILGEGPHMIQRAQSQRVHALVQDGLQGGFPPGVDLQLLPETAQAVQFLTLQPGFQSVFGLDLLLQSDQGLAAGVQPFQVEPRRLTGLPRLLQGGLQIGLAGFQFQQPGLGFFQARFRHRAFALPTLQFRRIGHAQRLQDERQALSAVVQAAPLMIGIALRLRRQGQVLFRAGQAAAPFVALQVQGPQPRVQIRQAVLRRLGLDGQGLGPGHGLVDLLLDFLDGALAMGLLVAPFLHLGLQLGASRLQAMAGIHHVADLGFQAADLGARLEQAPLSLVHRLAGGKMALAPGFQIGFQRPQARHG